MTNEKVSALINKNFQLTEKLNDLIDQIDDKTYQRMTFQEKIKLRGTEVVEAESHQDLAEFKNDENLYSFYLNIHREILKGSVKVHEGLVKKYS